MTLSIQADPVRPRHLRLGVLAALGVTIASCSSAPRETPIQKASAGDLLVEVGGSRVELVKPFSPGVANGQYKGIIKVTSTGDSSASQLHEVSAVCSLPDQPHWPDYDNLYGNPIASVEKAGTFSDKDRWQILYHFDGRVEKKGNLKSDEWASKLKDNLCRKGTFDDRKQTSSDKT
jgi:hypothetical protein